MATILLVEDEKELRDVLADFIQREGYTVYTAGNGEEGLKAASDKTPQLILVDIRMPVMSGYQMVTKLREGSAWGAKVPVIYLTNISPKSDEEQEDIAKTNPIDYIVKSDVDPDYVIKKIKQVLPA